MRRRIVITGIGVVSPLGADRESTWQAIQSGQRAVRRLEFPTRKGTLTALGAPAALAGIPEPAAALVLATGDEPERAGLAMMEADRRGPFDPDSYSPDSLLGWAGDMAEEPDRLGMLADRAANEAFADAGLLATGLSMAERLRAGCSIGTSKGDLERAGRAARQLQLTGVVDPRLFLGMTPDATLSRLAGRFGLLGPGSCPVAACATGLVAVTTAADWIADGRCDLALAGSADASLGPLLLGSYTRMGVLAPADGDEPAAAVRPFDRDRKGFAAGEGAAMFVLEEADRAVARGAAIYAELVGWSLGADANGVTALSDDPGSLARVIDSALARANVAPAALGHINAHGTATVANDRWETAAIKQALGPRAKHVSITANKAMIGHLLGAAGSVELALTVLALRDQFVPPTMNLDHPDPACDLDYTPRIGVKHPFDTALKLSIGFGGHLAAACVKTWAP